MADSKALIRLLPDVLLSDPHMTWALFRRAIIILAIEEGGAVDPIQGACAAILDGAEHIRIFGAASLPIAFARPAELPANSHVDAQRAYDRSMHLFEVFHAAALLLARQFNASVPYDFFSGVAIPAGQFVLTLQQKFAHMEGTFQTIPQGVLDARVVHLAKPIGSNVPLALYLRELS